MYLLHGKCEQVLWESKALKLNNVHMVPEQGWGQREGEWQVISQRGANLGLNVGGSLISQEQIGVIDELWGLN